MASSRIITVVFNDLPKAQKAAEQTGRTIVDKRAHDIQADIIASFSGPRSGRMYGAHQASAPGEAPAWDTGNLANNTNVTFPTEGRGRVAEVRVGTEYAPILEFGGVHMAPRPFMHPAADRAAELWEGIVGELFGKAFS